MRDFFINSLEKLISVMIVLMILLVIIGALAAGADAGVWALLGVLIAGGIYVILLGGFLYLAFGVYHNTQRTAEAVEAMARAGRTFD